MPAVSRVQLDASLRRSVFLQGLSAGEAKKIAPFLKQIDKALRDRLSGDELTAFSRTRLERLLADTEATLTQILGRWQKGLTKELGDIAVSEARFEAQALTRIVRNPDFESVLPGDEQIRAAVMAAPLLVRGAGGGQLMETLLTGFVESERDLIVGNIRRGFYEGQTNAQIIKGIRGTVALKYADGELAKINRHAEALTRTAVNHVATSARTELYRANADLVKGVKWLSVLDNRTSDICQGLSGTEWPIDTGPRPPAHINCRSTVVPILDERFDFLDKGARQAAQFGPVDAKETYFSWLQKQSPAFQDKVLGPVRGKLLRDGGLSAERFRQLRLDRNFKPLTLAEMQKLEPLAFERAGIRLNPETGRVVTAAQGSSGSAVDSISVNSPAFRGKLSAGFDVKHIDSALDSMDWAKKEVAQLREFVGKFKTATVTLSVGELSTAAAKTRASKWSSFQAKLATAPAGEAGRLQPDPGSIKFAGKTQYGGFTHEKWNYVQVTARNLNEGGFDFAETKLMREGLAELIERKKKGLVGDYDRLNPVFMGRMKGGRRYDRALYESLQKELANSHYGTSNFYTWLHEMGHQIHFRARLNSGRLQSSLDYRSRGDVRKDSLTKYGSTNSFEFAAEHFAMWVIDREALKSAFPAIVEYIDDMVAAALKSPILDAKP